MIRSRAKHHSIEKGKSGFSIKPITAMKNKIHWVKEWNTFAECPETYDWGYAMPLEKALCMWDKTTDENGNLHMFSETQWSDEAIKEMMSIQDACDEKEGDES